MGAPYYDRHGVTVHAGDCLDVLRTMADASVDAVVCDPPYGLADHKPAALVTALTAWVNGDREHVPDGRGFMGRDWDRFVPPPAVWDECLRVLKPGGHLLCFAGSRTVDLMGLSIRMAGFEIRDGLQWLYGCLDDQTEIMVDGQWERWDTAKQGRHALCYDLERDEFAWQSIQRVVNFPYRDTAYRLVGDHTDQLVTREHRCLVERGGALVFEQAEDAAREREARVPVLENVQGLLDALPLPHQGAGDTQDGLHGDVHGHGDSRQPTRDSCPEREPAPALPDLRHPVPTVSDEAARPAASRVLAEVQRRAGRGPTSCRCPFGTHGLDGGVDSLVPGEDDRRGEPGLEGRGNDLPQEGELRRGPVRPGASVGGGDGAQGRLRHGAPVVRGAGDRSAADAGRGCASHGSRPVEQPTGEPGSVQDESGSQAVRASRFTTTDLVRIEPVQYDGIAWCITVPTGAFVARRNGKVFVTGNSGFPKSLDVSKAIDKAAGAEREVVGSKLDRPGYHLHGHDGGEAFGHGLSSSTAETRLRSSEITAPATPDAQQWQGWGTALKPAHEPIVLARKPLSSTVAANVLAHGTGALNIDGCRTASEDAPAGRRRHGGGSAHSDSMSGPLNPEVRPAAPAGRWPSNVLLTHAARCDDPDQGCSPAWCPVAELDQQSGTLTSGKMMPTRPSTGERLTFGKDAAAGWTTMETYGDSGGGSRFFPVFRWEAKAPTEERPQVAGVAHPTVKPLALMRWLVRLVTPPGGLVLDPFAGSGTTLHAARAEGFRAVGIEREPTYLPLIKARLDARPRQAAPTTSVVVEDEPLDLLDFLGDAS